MSYLLRVSFIALIASVVNISATPSLAIKASALNVRVDRLENLKVITTVTNTGDEILDLLNDPRGVLSSFPEDSFSITSATGSRPLFNGAKVKYIPAYAASLDDPSVSTVLAPGIHINVTHDLSVAYNFTRSGPGDYIVKPSNHFIYVDADGTPKSLFATVENTAKVTLSGNLAVSRVYNKRADTVSVSYVHGKRVAIAGCSEDQKTKIAAAADAAQNYVYSANYYLLGISSGTERYTTWFGEYDDDHASTVKEHFELMSENSLPDFTYDCSTCNENGWIAYVHNEIWGTIYLCNLFWPLPDTGSDTKGGALLHEFSHFTQNGGSADFVYGIDECKALAISSKEDAVMNADSYQYFAENYPELP